MIDIMGKGVKRHNDGRLNPLDSGSGPMMSNNMDSQGDSGGV